MTLTQRQAWPRRAPPRMYLADERFRKNYDDLAPGLARYVHDAILANASRAGA